MATFYRAGRKSSWPRRASSRRSCMRAQPVTHRNNPLNGLREAWARGRRHADAMPTETARQLQLRSEELVASKRWSWPAASSEVAASHMAPQAKEADLPDSKEAGGCWEKVVLLSGKSYGNRATLAKEEITVSRGAGQLALVAYGSSKLWAIQRQASRGDSSRRRRSLGSVILPLPFRLAVSCELIHWHVAIKQKFPVYPSAGDVAPRTSSPT